MTVMEVKLRDEWNNNLMEKEISSQERRLLVYFIYHDGHKRHARHEGCLVVAILRANPAKGDRRSDLRRTSHSFAIFLFSSATHWSLSSCVTNF